MNGKRIILTGAAGGIGGQLAGLLAAAGARLLLTDINSDGLRKLQVALGGADIAVVVADLCNADDRRRIVETAQQRLGGTDILINSAGINPFGAYADQDEALIRRTLDINTLGPMLLTHSVLPAMRERNSGHIVNIGSTFGSIGFAWFSAYSASKFALRGFSQSLRRELADTDIKVTYVAPRAVKTAINSPAVYDMAVAVRMTMDEPDVVARRIVRAIGRRKKERYIGFPESLFVRINAVLPGLVDLATRTRNRKARTFAEPRADTRLSDADTAR